MTTIAVVGATGAVGKIMLRVLEEQNVPVDRLIPIASQSNGRVVTFRGQDLPVVGIGPNVFEGVDLALFSAGGSVSREWAPIAAKSGAIVIDNSSAFRRDPEVPLVLFEVNMEHAQHRPKGIIANPNCSTMQMVLALKPLHDAAALTRITVATYQAISGAGSLAIEAFEKQQALHVNGELAPDPLLKGQLAGNLLMHWAPDPSGYQEEELKMVFETQKILADDTIRVSPTAVRVPVLHSHSMALTIEMKRPMPAKEARELLEKAPGIRVIDDLAAGRYPQPIFATGSDLTFVGRIRDDIGNPGGIQMWVVSDNLRKGAATNAVQIASELIGP